MTKKAEILRALRGLTHEERLEVIDALVVLCSKEQLAEFLKAIATERTRDTKINGKRLQ